VFELFNVLKQAVYQEPRLIMQAMHKQGKMHSKGQMLVNRCNVSLVTQQSLLLLSDSPFSCYATNF